MTLFCGLFEGWNEFAEGGFLGHANDPGSAATRVFFEIIKHKKRSCGLRVAIEELDFFPREPVEEKSLVFEAIHAQPGLGQRIHMLQMVAKLTQFSIQGPREQWIPPHKQDALHLTASVSKKRALRELTPPI